MELNILKPTERKMQTIRRSVFETNSSSTHSLTIVSKEEFEKFKAGDLFIGDDEEFYTRDQVISDNSRFISEEELNPEEEDDFDAILENGGYKSYDQYMHYGDLESFAQSHKTKSGDEIVAFGLYGYDR